MPKRLRVAGLDIASRQSGLCIIEAGARKLRPPLSYKVLHQEGVRSGEGFLGRVETSKHLINVIDQHDVHLVALEECVPIGGSTTSIQQSAQLEMVMFQLYELGIPFMVIPPTTMRSFIQAKTGKEGKTSIIDNTLERYGFKAEHSRQKERSDISDAFVHSYIGMCVLFAQRGELTDRLLPSESNVIWGNKKKMVGLLDRDIFYHKKDDA